MTEVKPQDLPAHVQSLYRIRPDRRFLYAAAELHRLATGAPRRGTLVIRFEENRWHLSLDGSPLADLPDYPSFADAKTYLVALARSQPAFRGAPTPDPLDGPGRAALENGLSADVFSALARLDAAWKTSAGDPGLVDTSLRGFLWLALQTYDDLELSDPILGKALALLAIAEARARGRFVREESLLASLLGYEDQAKLVAQGLPADEPVRLFAEWNLAGLKARANRSPRDPRAEYLYLLRLAQNDTKEDPWFAEFEKSSWGAQVDGPSLRLVLTLDPFGLRQVPSTLMESQILEGVLPRPSTAEDARPGAAPALAVGGWRGRALRRFGALSESGQKPPEELLAELEEAVGKEASRREGPLLDGSTVRAFHLANFYSAVYAAARYLFDSLGTTEGAEELGNSLKNPPAGTAAELKDWILHRVQLRRSADALRNVAADISRLRHIGTAPLSRISHSIRISLSSNVDPNKRAFVPGLFDRLDSRPSDLHIAFRTAYELLSDPAIMETCGRLAATRGPRQMDRDLPWDLRFLGDRVALTALAKDNERPPAIRTVALQELAALEKTEPRFLVEQFHALMLADTADTAPLSAAVEILEKAGDIGSALQLIDEWLKAHTGRGLPWASASSLKSRLLRKQGKFEEAWPIAEAAAETWKEECLREATLTLIDLGRLDDALEMAKRAVDRYGSGDYESPLMARVLWMQGKDDEAARLLVPPAKPLTPTVWDLALPAAFLEAFRKVDDDRAEAAFLKLAAPGVPTLNLLWFVDSLSKGGRARLAVRLCGHLRGRSPSAWVTAATYHAIGRVEGPAAAQSWLAANATPADMEVFPLQAYQNGDVQLLWDLPDHPNPTKNELLYSLRAASLLQPDQASDERRARVLAFFQGRARKDFVVYGLFFLGEVDRATVFAEIKDPTYLCTIGWILGLCSAHEGRFEEANAWLQVCLESGANVPPRSFGDIILAGWMREGSTLSELERRKVY